jgi:methyl-accepting chemotaxis protein
MLANLRISMRLSLLIALMVAALATVGSYSAYALRHAQQEQAASLQLARDLMEASDEVRTAEVNFRVQVQEYKNILLRGHDRKDYDRYLDSFRKRGDAVERRMASAKKAMAKVGLKTDELEEAARLHREITRQYVEALAVFDVDQPHTTGLADAMVRGKDRPLEERMERVVDTVEKFAQDESARIAQAANQQAREVMLVLAALIAVVLAGSVLFARIIAAGISTPVRQAAEAAERVARGDLTVSIEARTQDETGQLLRAVGTMAHNLRELVSELAGRAHAVADSSAQVAQGNVDLAQRTEEQATSLEETASQMEELTSTVGQNADHARQASELAAGASRVATRGGEVVGEVVSTMDGISDASRKIADIIGVIDGIAFQTNILALNAAVEAARAGDQGRGFAVVAAEVRNLAQRSAAAAKEIKGLIGASVEKVDAGSRLVASAGATMGEIVDAVQKVNALVAEIASASQEQSAGIEQVNAAVTQMDQVVQQNAALVEEASAATESMKEQARGLLQAVSRFDLGHAPAPAAFLSRAIAVPEKAAAPVKVAHALPTMGLRPALATNGDADWKQF